MKNIHVLPTDKPSRLHFTEEEELVFTPRYEKLDGVNIYITSDEEIKEGDWYINTFVSEREQKPQTHTEKRHLINHQKDYRFKYCKKIILTTDQDLIGVQAIDDEFLEWFVKNQSCESVKVEGHIYKGQDETEYKIIIPSEEPKQETLEEVAETFWLNDNTMADKDRISYVNGFLTCAKWQMDKQERSYSEEDMKSAFKVGFSIGYGSDVHAIDEKNRTCDEWFEQFKKK
jgi:hypothetical protein